MQMYAQSTHLHNVYHVNVSPKNKYTTMYIVHICTVHVNISFLNKNHSGNSLYKLRAITGSSDGGTTSSTTLGALSVSKRSDKDWEGLWVFRSSWIEKQNCFKIDFIQRAEKVLTQQNHVKRCRLPRMLFFRNEIIGCFCKLGAFIMGEPAVFCEYMQKRCYPKKQLIL